MKSFQPGVDVDASLARYRDWGLLKYWFRGVEKYAPWVRHVFFVTDQQCPPWLNTSHPKLRLVDHQDFIPAAYLPTFNSNSLDLHLHRIKGLSEQFVYFNDDVFLLQPTVQEDFFRSGLPCDAAVLSPVVVSGWDDVGSTVTNNLCLINRHFTKGSVMRKHFRQFYNLRYGTSLLRTLCLSPWRHLVGFQNHHVAQSFLKQTFEEVWESEPQILHETCSHRFRNYKLDVNQWLMRYWQFTTGQFAPVAPRKWKDLPLAQTEETAHAIKSQRYQRICINDSAIDSFEQTRDAIIAAFDHLLPTPCSFEKG